MINYKPKKSETAVDRLKSRIAIDPSTNCWNWLGSTNGTYGQIYIDNKKWFVHRASFKFIKNIDPRGFLVCHRCDNPICINPDHLFLGNNKENTKDMILKGRGKLHLYKGVSHSFSKFNENEVRIIREAADAEFSKASIARYFKVDPSTISYIALRQNYKNIL